MMLGLVALPTPPQDAQASRPKPLPSYSLPVVSGQPPPAGIFYRPTAAPQQPAADSPPWSTESSPFLRPASPPLEPEVRDGYQGVGSRSLPIEDRKVMYTLMSLGTSSADCQMAVDVIKELIPPAPGSRPVSSKEQASRDSLLRRYLFYWTSLTPHPLCVLIGLMILLERLKSLHPSLSATGEVKDTTLRVIFSAYLLAMKLISDVSYMNRAFLQRCPWTQKEINSMEKELCHHLNYDVFIASDALLDRAKAFWARREAEQARLQGDDGIPDFTAGGVFGENLFLTSQTGRTGSMPPEDD